MLRRLLFELLGPMNADQKASPVAAVDVAASGKNLFGYSEGKGYGDLIYRYGIIHAAVHKIAGAAATLPFFVRDENGDVAKDGPLVDLLARPNSDMDWRHFFELIAVHWRVYGDVFVLVVRSPVDRMPIEIWPLNPKLMSVRFNDDGTVARYEYGSGTGRKKVYMPEDGQIIHVRTPSANDPTSGASIIPNVLPLGDILNMYSNKLYESLEGGINSPTVLSFSSRDKEMRIGREGRDRIKEAISEFVSGGSKSGSVITVFDVDVAKHDLQRRAIEADDMDARNEIKREICFLLGIPPVLLGLRDDSTYNNYRTALSAFYTDTVLPSVAEPLVSGLNRGLGVDGYEIAIDRDRIPVLAEQRIEMIDKANAANFMSINEKRAMIGLPPVENGDVMLVPASQVPLDDAVAPEPASPKKAAEVYSLADLKGQERG